MRLVIQRVREASVEVGQQEVARIGPGLVVLVGFTVQDDPKEFSRIAKMIVQLRLFDDSASHLNRSLAQTSREVLVVPEITLVASLAKGTRPSFDPAAPLEQAKALFEAFVQSIAAIHPRVAAGVFQAHMVVRLANDGPVTFVLDEAS